jgi:hypothetical protein
MPSHCGPSPKPRILSSVFGAAVGFYPIWSVEIAGHPAMLRCGNSCARTRYGWGHKNLLVVAPQFRSRIILEGALVHGKGRLWFENEDPNHALVKFVKLLRINPEWQRNPSTRYAYIEFPGSIIFPRSGMYYLEALYPGGKTCFTFSAVR